MQNMTLAFLTSLGMVQFYHVTAEHIPAPDYMLLCAGFTLALTEIFDLWDRGR